MSEKVDNTLEGFSGWDSELGEIDFFGSETVVLEDELKKDEPEETIDEDGKQDNKSETKEVEEDPFADFASGDKSDTDDDDPIDFTDDGEGDDKPSKTDDKPVKKAPVEDTRMASLKLLKEKGLLDFELEEGQELDDIDSDDLFEQGLERSTETRVKELMSGLPKELQQLNKFVLEGGSFETLLGRMAADQGNDIKTGLDLSDTTQQEKVLLKLMEEEGTYDEEVIKAQISAFKDSGVLEKTAKAKYAQWEKGQEKKREEEGKATEQRKTQEREARKEFKRNLSTLTSKGEAKGIKLSRKEKQELPGYASDLTVKLQDGRTTTQMQYDLAQSMRDPEKVALIAKILKSDFDFSAFERKAKTEVTRAERESIRRNKDKTPQKSSGGSSQPKSLADYF